LVVELIHRLLQVVPLLQLDVVEFPLLLLLFLLVLDLL
jgi:hypothetical protein